MIHRQRAVNVARAGRSRRNARLYLCNTRRDRLAQHLQDVASELRPFIEKEHAVMSQRHLASIGMWPPPISSTSEIAWWGRDMGA
jgi:hypothetical protein